jgi:hypothetical protein
MSRISCAVLVCVAASAVAVQAQNPPVQPTPSAGPSSSTITVTGCVENAVADGSLGGTPLGTSATPANAGVVANVQPPVNGFLLTGARPAPSAAATAGNNAPAPTGTAGVAAPGNPDASKDELKTYALEGNTEEFAVHKGHRVEITGSLAPAASSGANRPAGRGADPFETGVQRLRVQTVTMISANCSEGAKK